ncbi:response regulator [Flammeovirga sp. SubArs3]|uniref:response regulator n=1 Tax=Flammeovirga sp. SubArs3 TaxID=2995316 RepID=UPI00248CF949|nr:response regulator [Flammeovirga sp. SubArs3]
MDFKIGNTKLDFNKLYPFHFLLDRSLSILSVGKSFEKLFPDCKFEKLDKVLKLVRPWSIEFGYEEVQTQLQKVFVFQNQERDIVLRGQIIILEEDKNILFLGSPWMKSTDELVTHKLSLTDFALNDPTPDAVQLLKMNEINLLELRELTTKLKQQKSIVEEKEILYRGLVENASEIIVRTNKEGKLLYVNPSAESITGYTEFELLGKTFFDFITPDMYEQISEQFLQQTLQKKDKDVYEFSITNKNGKIIWLYQTVISIKGENDEIIGYTSVGIDISLRKEMEETLERAREKAIESSRVKERFIANTSHELRTPMNAIIGLSNLLTKTPLLPKQSEFINAIKTSAENLLVVINDVLDISKIESEKLEIESIEFDLTDRIKSFVKSLEIRATEKNILLNHTMDEDIHPTLKGDPYRLNQVLTNLVSNAIKFTSEGEVKVEVFVDKENSNDEIQNIIFKVIDTGEGIPKEKHHKIFEGFSQADVSVTRKFGGTGLGLTISRSLIELMGGEISLESEVGIGSTFIVSIPFEKCESTTTEEKPLLNSEDIDWSDFDVLLVEDNQFNQLLAENILLQWKLNIDIADNGKIAIEKLKKKNYDVILMDIQMPEMDGIETTQYVRNKLQIGTPIIALTANAMKSDLDSYREKGMEACVTKPFQQDDLQRELSKIFDQKEIIDEHGVDHSKWSGKNILLVEDNQYNQLLVVNILNRWGLNVDTADDGDEAISFIQRKEYDLILMDIQMPKMDGVEASKKIRKSFTQDVPIIAFSANLTPEYEKEFLEVGMNGCIPKPFKVGQLKKVIHDVFYFEPNETKPELHRPEDSWRGKKVLVVEDNMFNQLLVVNILEGWGMEIKTAENGQKAVDLVKENDFDIILMDIQMPVMDGVEATKIIRGDLHKNLPIIALTANSSRSEQNLYMKTGMDACVSKPFDLEDFEKTIKGFLQETNDKAHENKNQVEEKDWEGIRVLIVEDNSFNLLLLKGILEGWKMNIMEAENGQVAVDLCKKHQFDIILMDIQMPVMDGVDATKIMRDELNIDVPIIAITANSEKELVKKYLKVGMNACIPKPYGQEQLQKSIMKYL